MPGVELRILGFLGPQVQGREFMSQLQAVVLGILGGQRLGFRALGLRLRV